jgi:D-arabinose 1-dehydrogenase-like Zn-dependent alcohol dehydrogenase
MKTNITQATVWGALQTADTAPDEPIGIVGIGGLGSLCVQFAKALGHPVVAIDNRVEGRDLAQAFSLKADMILNEYDDGTLEKIKSWTEGLGLPCIVVCTDNVDAIHWSLSTLRPHGVCVPLGLPVAGFKFDAFKAVFSTLVIKGSLVCTKDQAVDMMKVVDKFGVKSHITVFPMEKVPEFPGMYMDPHLKGRLVMGLAS